MKHPPPCRYSRFVIFGTTSVGCKCEYIYLYTAFFRGRHRTHLTVVYVRMGSIGLSIIKLCIQL